jgi:hypothetical protein
VSRARLLKTAAAGAVGVVAVGAGAQSTAVASGRARRDIIPLNTTSETFTAVGSDVNYTPDATIGFDASDTSSGLEKGISAYGSANAIDATTDNPHGFAIICSNSHSQAAAKVAFGAIGCISVTGYGLVALTESGTGVAGGAGSTGVGVFGESANGIGVHATSSGFNSPALLAEQTKSGDAIHGTSKSSRGAVLSGGKAALKLTPTNTNSHPSGGQPGDLMVDRFHRFWFCQRGGNPATWKLIA